MDIRNGDPMNVVYPQALRYGIRNAVNSWKLFCALPVEEKLRFPYADDPVFDGSGYELKDQGGPTRDRKENFHVVLGQSVHSGNDVFDYGIHDAIQFIGEADALIGLASDVIKNFAGYVEEVLSLPDFQQEVMNVRDRWIFRYIHYFGNCNPGDQIAAPHADRSGFTLHLFESEPGLEYLTSTRQWKPMHVSEGQTVIIPGMQLQLASWNQARAICHRVIANEATARVGRYSVVCFIPLANTKICNKTFVGRLQDREPGFNYDLPFDEFQKLFA